MPTKHDGGTPISVDSASNGRASSDLQISSAIWFPRSAWDKKEILGKEGGLSMFLKSRAQRGIPMPTKHDGVTPVSVDSASNGRASSDLQIISAIGFPRSARDKKEILGKREG